MTAPKLVPSDMAVINEVTALCRSLRLKYFREQLADVMLTARAQRWDPTEALRVLLTAEIEGRDRSTVENRRRRAHFPAGKTFKSWVEPRSSIPATTQRALRSLEWVTRAENLVVAGPQGTGKSHLLEAVGHHSIDQGLSVAWFSVEDLGAIIRRHRVDDTISKAFTALASTQLTIIDDIGLLPISTDAAEGLYRLVDAAYERRSLALSTNLHPSGFDQLMDKTIASALVDRLYAPCPPHRHRRRVSSPRRRHRRQRSGAPGISPGRSPNVHREFPWPSLGKPGGRPRGLLVAVPGEFP